MSVSPRPRDPSARPRLSVVLPCFDEEAIIDWSHDRLSRALAGVDADVEIIFVNDGSRDRTADLLDAVAARDPRVRVIHFSRNFGQQMAMSAGIDHATGDAVVIIDSDLQDPPEVIPAMLAKWREGYDIVYGVRARREGESPFKLMTARWYYRAMKAMAEMDVPLDAGDFRLIDRAVADAVRSMRERDRFLRGMVSWVGFSHATLPYVREARTAGETKWTPIKLVRLALDGMLSFSLRPLRFVIALGLSVVALAVAGVIFAIVNRLLTDNWVSGWTMLFIAILFTSGVQLVVMGMIGEYVGRIYMASKGRPLYLVARRAGFERDDAG